MKQLLGNPNLEVTHVNDVKSGTNHIVVDSVQRRTLSSRYVSGHIWER